MDHFDRMPLFLRERIHAEGWTSWRGVQEDSFDVLFRSDDHLLISAGTSSGKTEAAMLPVISSLYDHPTAGVGALYIGPTKALIDDQFARLDRMLRDSRITVTGWHGDIPSNSKDRMRREPEGILQITPESLQGVVCDGPDLLRRMFPDLRFVIIDEVHAFMASDRGLQLLCELATIERVTGCSPRRIGLSATLSDLGSAEEWLGAGTDRRVVTVRSDSSEKRGRVGVKHYRIPAEGDMRGQLTLAYYKDLFRLTDQYSCIVFTNSRGSAERTALSLSKVSAAEGSRNIVRIHHGSLSGTIRKDAEADLKGGTHPTVVATSTLELGMDVGGLDRVVQIGAPYSCSSMLQRMGRTGRRGGRREMVICCLVDERKWSPSPAGMSMELIRAIAVTDLALKGWTEGIRSNPLPFGLLYHQMMAYLKGTDHDVRWPELRDAMLSMWPFRNISKEEARELAMHLVHEGHLQRMEDGTIIIGLKAEPIVNGKDFASVFEAPAETEVRHKGEVVGTVQGNPKEGYRITLAGRFWEVVRKGDGWVDVKEATESLTEARWESMPPEVDDRVLERMREVLESEETFPWLDSKAVAELAISRSTYRSNGYDDVVDTPAGYMVFPWLGTRSFEGMKRALNDIPEVEVVADASPLWIEIRTPKTWGMVEQGLRNIVRDHDGEDFVLMADVDDMGKYERFVPEGLRAREFAAHRLSFDFIED